jgi:gluconokinase
MRSYWMALDIGTTSAKICGVKDDGWLLGSLQQVYPVYEYPAGGREQRPDDIVRAIAGLIKQAVSRWGQPAAIGLSGAMHSLLAVDRAGKPLSPLLIWSDHRSLEVYQAYKASWSDIVYRYSGIVFHPMLPLCKILYWKQLQPSWLGQVHQWVSMKEYVLYQLTGAWATDYAMAGATGMFDLQRFDWHADMLQRLDIDLQALPPVVAPDTVFEVKDKGALAGDTDLQAGIPVLVGASDGCLATLGSGLVGSADLSITVATSAAVRRWAAYPVLDPQQRTFCYALSPHDFVIGTAHNNAGGILPWLRRLFGEQNPDPHTLNRWMDDVLSVAAGADGLMCLPYVLGERSPVWDPQASAAWVGIRDIHQPRHFQRAMLEGVGLTLRQSIAVVEQLLGPSKQCLLSGGITHAPAWMQLLADILNQPLQVAGEIDASCAGALQLIARMYGAEHIQFKTSYSEKRPVMVIPQPESAALYTGLQQKFNRLYPLLKQWQEGV